MINISCNLDETKTILNCESNIFLFNEINEISSTVSLKKKSPCTNIAGKFKNKDINVSHK